MVEKTSSPGSASAGDGVSPSTGRTSLHGTEGATPKGGGAPSSPKGPKRRRRRPLVATLSGLLSFVGIAAIALVVVWALALQRVSAPGPLPADKVVDVQPGNDISVANQLADAGVIENSLLMTSALWLGGERGNVKSGEYLFKQGSSVRDVIDLLISGKQLLHGITVPEGLTSEQVVERLRDNDVLVGDIAAVPAEGTLMPDTYKFARGTTREQVVRSMQAEAKKVLAEIWARRAPDTIVHSPFELVTLASIVEKETGRPDERPRVAAVFVNRLSRNMPLQSDPTIVYGLVGGKGTLGRGILRSELEQKTPYNTYQIQGLPPGPIANPGKAALEAVANPAHTRDLYFVADGTGGHAFSDTLAQHQQNVLRWRQIEKDAKDKLSPDAAPATPARNNLRGDAADPQRVFGSLDLDISGQATARVASVTSLPLSGFAPSQASAFAAPSGPTTLTADGTTFNELDVEVDGVRSRSDPNTWADGDIAAPAVDPTLQSYAVPPDQLAAQRARAAALGLPVTAASPSPADGAPPATGTAPNGTKLYGKGHIIDASEGTALDPLKDHSYDLMSAKVVPAMKPLPPIVPLASR